MTVQLSTIKEALKIDYADDDAQLVRLREAAWNHIQRVTQLSLEPKAYALEVRDFDQPVMIPIHPLIAVTEIAYISQPDGDYTPLTVSDYWIDKSEPLPVVRFLKKYQQREGTNITVSYTAGFTELPGELTQAIIALVGAWYSNPEALQPGSMAVVPLSLQYIIDSYSVRSMIR